MAERITINFLAKADTKEKLQQLAELTERSQSAYIRWLIDREWDIHFTKPENGNQKIEG